MGAPYSTRVGNPPNINTSFGDWLLNWFTPLLNLRTAYCSLPRSTNYYVSNAFGSDSNDGLWPWTAFKTIAKAKTIYDASSGDISIRLMAGDEWNELVGIAQDKTFTTIEPYGTGDMPFLNRFTVKYNRTGWTNASGDRYTRTEANNIAWVRDQNDRLNPYTRCDSAAQVAMIPLSFYYDSGGTTLHINCGVGVNPNNKNLESVISNESSGINVSGDGSMVKGIRVDGFDMSNSVVSPQMYCIKASPSGTDEVLVTDCAAYYSSTHVIAQFLSGTGGIATFVRNKAGLARVGGGAVGESIFNTYTDGGTHEAIFYECVAEYGTLPSMDWLSVSGVTMTIASPCVVTYLHNTLAAGDAIKFTTTGALPTGLVVGTTYYVLDTGITTHTFRVSATPGGSAINTSGSQSGVHTLYKLNTFVRGQTIYGHTAGGAAKIGLVVSYAMTTKANKWGCEFPCFGFGDLPTASVITDCRGFIVGDVFEENNKAGLGISLAPGNQVLMNSYYALKPRTDSSAAITTTAPSGWSINNTFQLDMSNINETAWAFVNSGTTVAPKIYGSTIRIKNSSRADFTISFSQYFGSDPWANGEMINTIVTAENFTGGKLAYLGFNNNTNSHHNAFRGLTQDNGNPRGYNLQTGTVALSALVPNLQPGIFNSQLNNAGSPLAGTSVDVYLSRRSRTTPSIGPVEEAPRIQGVNFRDPAPVNNFVNTAKTRTYKIIPLSGALDEANQNYVCAEIPKLVIINGIEYESTGGAITWSFASGILTLSTPIMSNSTIHAVTF